MREEKNNLFILEKAKFCTINSINYFLKKENFQFKTKVKVFSTHNTT